MTRMSHFVVTYVASQSENFRIQINLRGHVRFYTLSFHSVSTNPPTMHHTYEWKNERVNSSYFNTTLCVTWNELTAYDVSPLLYFFDITRREELPMSCSKFTPCIPHLEHLGSFLITLTLKLNVLLRLASIHNNRFLTDYFKCCSSFKTQQAPRVAKMN